MMVGRRARTDEQKESRRQDILAAASRLFLEAPAELPSVQAIAHEADLAKGTVYLYFETKEEIYLEIVTELFKAWFSKLGDDLGHLETPVRPRELARVLTAPVVGNDLFLRLAARLQTVIEPNLVRAKALAFKHMLGEGMSVLAGRIAELTAMEPAEAIVLLRESYAAIIGYWLACQTPETLRSDPSLEKYDFLFFDFPTEVERLIERLWLAALTPGR